MGMACLATRERIESPILKEIATRLVHSGYTGRYKGRGVEGWACVYGRGWQLVENRVTYQVRLALAPAVNSRILARNWRKTKFRNLRSAHSSMPAPAVLLGGHLYIIGRLVQTHIYACQSARCPHTFTGSHVFEGRLRTDGGKNAGPARRQSRWDLHSAVLIRNLTVWVPHHGEQGRMYTNSVAKKIFAVAFHLQVGGGSNGSNGSNSLGSNEFM